ncbi:hypothetical protein GH714_009215 [Hevea brasiliensis]|uniref:Uncharacterized protein n=1 Tax=Hevea brasiliensis TaxID=3981 RepID=A0A6A6KAQ3_HEVBR|nr:hypothetical protein GH714_009215 [Hevea brasiliensis]
MPYGAWMRYVPQQRRKGYGYWRKDESKSNTIIDAFTADKESPPANDQNGNVHQDSNATAVLAETAEDSGATSAAMLISPALRMNFNHKKFKILKIFDFSIHRLQSDIAKEARFDVFAEECTRKRSAKLHKGLPRRNKCVLILDRLSAYFHQDEVGIPTQASGCNHKHSIVKDLKVVSEDELPGTH